MLSINDITMRYGGRILFEEVTCSFLEGRRYAISGVALIIAGLGLATLERMPQRESEWVDAVTTLGRFGFGWVAPPGHRR